MINAKEVRDVITISCSVNQTRSLITTGPWPRDCHIIVDCDQLY